MYVAPVDATLGEQEWRSFIEANPFGHLVAPGGPERALPVVVPTQFVLAGMAETTENTGHPGLTVWLHLVRANPVFAALDENPRVLLSVAGDWAFVPSSWKAVGDEDPTLGIPTTYYGAVQLAGAATVHDERTSPGSVAAILRRQLATFQPAEPVADPSLAHPAKLLAILGIEIRVEQVSAKFKYGGNVDEPHRRAVVERLRGRGAPGDEEAARHVLRRLRA
jgi:transcriptional regulator